MTSEEQPTIELDTLLFGTPSWNEVVDFWQRGEFHGEEYQVPAIKKHLRTDAQRKILADLDISIEEMLHGRIDSQAGNVAVKAIFEEWNKKLGFHYYGY